MRFMLEYRSIDKEFKNFWVEEDFKDSVFNIVKEIKVRGCEKNF